jgi:hypothetical protein
MTQPRTKQAVLDDDFLMLRARILELAAGLDRFDRAAGEWPGDVRRTRLDEAIRLLLGGEPNRAEQVQLHFSRAYEPGWREELGV